MRYIIPVGTNALTGVVVENRKISSVRLVLRIDGLEVAAEKLDDPDTEFAITWVLPAEAVGMGTTGIVEVRATDILLQTDVVEIPVVLGALTLDDDPDGDLVPSPCDNCPPYPNNLQLDCDTDGIGDVCEIAAGTSPDVNTDGVPDSCIYDCNDNEIVDVAEILAGSAIDCNGDSTLDICQERLVVYVNPAAGAGEHTGENWDDAYADPAIAFPSVKRLGGALSDIWLAAGTYTPDLATGDREMTFQLPPCTQVYGGFEPGDEWVDRDPRTKQTIFSGDLLGDDAPDFANRSDNSHHVVTAGWTNAQALLDGVIVQGGNAAGDSLYPAGGGMLIVRDISVANCVFSDNRAPNGGGIAVIEGAAQIDTSTVSDNDASTNGAGIYVATGAGAQIANTLVARNTSGFEGGGVYLATADALVVNCTVVDNYGLESSGGIYVADGSPVIRNSIIWGNTAKSDPLVDYEYVQINPSYGASTPDVQYTCVENIDTFAAGIGNTGDDPMIFDSFLPDAYVLSVSSPLVDAGASEFATTNSFDLGAHPREVGGVVDLGAWEFVLCDYADDGRVCLDDLAYFIDNCLDDGGPETQAAAACAGAFDQDEDGDVDMADYQRSAQCYGTYKSPEGVCGAQGQGESMEFSEGGEGGESMMASSEGGELASSSAVEENPEEPRTASLAIEVQPLGGGDAVTTLAAHTEYELHYTAGNDAINTLLVMSISSNAVESVTATAAAGGDWASAGNFTFVDFSEDDPPVQAPGYAEGLYWYSLAMDGFWGGTGSAGDAGYLCRFTTGAPGALTLDVQLIGEEEEATVLMSASHNWMVE